MENSKGIDEIIHEAAEQAGYFEPHEFGAPPQSSINSKLSTEELSKLRQIMNNRPCPCCGHCPTCGRGNRLHPETYRI